jgi:adenosylmethionine-8-amino-7-oxononanoate aminotransferase
VWVRPFGDILYLTPALVIPQDDLDLLIESLGATVRECVADGTVLRKP